MMVETVKIVEFFDYLKQKSIPYTINEDGSVVVFGDLCIADTNIGTFPDELFVAGRIFIAGNSKVLRFPKKLTVWYTFNLGAPSSPLLPSELSCRDLVIAYETKITMLPKNIKAESIWIDNCSCVENITYRKGCGEHLRTIFACQANGGVMVAAGCFLGTLEEFEAAVDKKYKNYKYKGEAAEEYKAKARECVNEFIEKKLWLL